MTTLFIAGASGLVGSTALSLALADARVTRVVAPTRRPIAPHPKLLNPDMADTGSEGWAADGAICALGTTRAKAGSAEAFRAVDHDLVLAIAARLREHGVARFALTSSLGADARSRLLYPRTKGEVEEAVERLGFPSLTILRPGFLDGDRSESRPVEQWTGRLLRFMGPILPASARVSPVPTVAAMLLAAALEGAPGRHVVSSADIARAT